MSSHYYHPILDSLIDHKLRAIRKAQSNGMHDPSMLRELIERALCSDEPVWVIGVDWAEPGSDETAWVDAEGNIVVDQP